jgi:hypothetical protein
MARRNTSGTRITNPAFAKTQIPTQRGKFAVASPPPDPIVRKPRARLGEQLGGERVIVTNPAAARTTKQNGGTA